MRCVTGRSVEVGAFCGLFVVGVHSVEVGGEVCWGCILLRWEMGVLGYILWKWWMRCG